MMRKDQAGRYAFLINPYSLEQMCGVQLLTKERRIIMMSTGMVIAIYSETMNWIDSTREKMAITFVQQHLFSLFFFLSRPSICQNERT